MKSDAISSGAVFDVAIVSVFGRGNWMAQELARLGSRVCLIDCTATLLKRSGDTERVASRLIDAEGPFGFFAAEAASSSMQSRLFDDGNDQRPSAWMTELGPCIWDATGPIEGRSDATDYQLAGHGLSSSVGAFLRWPRELTEGSADRAGAERAAGRERARLTKAPFDESWLAALALQMSSTTYVSSGEALSALSGLPTPLFAGLWLRRPTPDGVLSSFGVCAASGATVAFDASVNDLRLSARVADALEISGIERESAPVTLLSHAFVWSLTGSETAIASPRVAETLFADGPAKPDWLWMRARVALARVSSAVALPDWIALVEDPFAAWTHDNLAIVRATGRVADPSLAGKIERDVWLRLPRERALRNADYVRTQFERVCGHLSQRIPGAEARVVEVSREASSDFAGAPLQPAFESSGARASRLRSPNLYYDGPETWATLDWNGSYERQGQIVAQIERQRGQRLVREAKALVRAGVPSPKPEQEVQP